MLAISMYNDIREHIKETMNNRNVDKDTIDLTMALVDNLIRHCKRVDNVCITLKWENDKLRQAICKRHRELGIDD